MWLDQHMLLNRLVRDLPCFPIPFAPPIFLSFFCFQLLFFFHFRFRFSLRFTSVSCCRSFSFSSLRGFAFVAAARFFLHAFRALWTWACFLVTLDTRAHQLLLMILRVWHAHAFAVTLFPCTRVGCTSSSSQPFFFFPRFPQPLKIRCG